jgi:hypothetical protein
MRDNFPRAKYMQNADAKKIQLLGNKAEQVWRRTNCTAIAQHVRTDVAT